MFVLMNLKICSSNIFSGWKNVPWSLNIPSFLYFDWPTVPGMSLGTSFSSSTAPVMEPFHLLRIVKYNPLGNVDYMKFLLSFVFSGAMGTSLLDRRGFLCGSSTISYAFLTAHLANSISVSMSHIGHFWKSGFFSC